MYPGGRQTTRPKQRVAQEKTSRARTPAPVADLGSSDLAPPRMARKLNQPLVVLACVVLLAVCVVGWRSWRNRREHLPQVAQLGLTEGLAALDEGNFDHAYQLLSEAKTAVDDLKGAVEGAEKIRHGADEAAIFVSLLTDPLENLLDEAARMTPQAWADKFDTYYRGRGVIISATITATPNTPGSSRYELDYLVLAPGQGAQEHRYARIDLTGFEAVTLAGYKEGDPVNFGAKLAAFEYDAEAKEWLIRFEPKTGIAIHHYKALETLGWPTDSSIPEANAEGQDQP